jgi:hypothetical protein
MIPSPLAPETNRAEAELVREGRSAAHAVEDRDGERDAALAAITLLGLTLLIPPQLVVPGLGAAGRPAALFSLGLLALWGASRFIKESIAEPTVSVRWAFYIFMLAFTASYLVGIDRGLPGIEARAMDRKALVVIGFLGIFLSFTDGLRSRDSVCRVLRWLVGLGAVNALVGLVQFVFKIDPAEMISVPGLVYNREIGSVGTRGLDDFTRVRGLMRHPIEFGIMMATLLPIAIQVAMSDRNPKRSRRLWLATALIGASVPLSISRSATIGLVIGLAIISVGWSWRTRANGLAIGVAGVVGFQAIVPGLLGTIKGLFTRLESDSSITARTEDYGATAEFIRQRPWLGRGPGTFISGRYRTLDNEYLGTILETGYVGLAALLLLMLSGIMSAIWVVRHTHPESAEVARGLAAGVAVSMFAFATFDALSFPIYATTFVVLLGCIGALRRIEGSMTIPESWVRDATGLRA